MSTIQPYHDNASHYFAQYQSVSFEAVHGDWLDHLPTQPGFALDVGAGSGRDAKALAERGWQVLAVEPAQALRELGSQATLSADVQWLDDRLPEMTKVRSLTHRYQLILVSAVWMHLRPHEQQRALRVLTSLLAPGGLLVMTFRQGESGDDRDFFEASAAQLDRCGQDLALVPVKATQSDDRLGRQNVAWQLRVFRLPDDGTGALPVLRHVIVNDDKSSTYKPGLLRTLTRLADNAPVMVLSRNDDWVTLPLGAVGLFWIKLYRQLILDRTLRQAPGSKGYGFAKEAFQGLSSLSPMDLRIGSVFHAPQAATMVLRAIRDACYTIIKMPAYFTTWPGSQQPLFEGDLASLRLRTEPAHLDIATLSRFGTFRIPTLLWARM